MSLRGIWNWLKGNAKCPRCGFYDTAVYNEEILDVRQAWGTDTDAPPGRGPRPQAVFNYIAMKYYCNCNNCKYKFYYNDVIKRRA